MGFKGLDVSKMFSEAVNASEDTGENLPGEKKELSSQNNTTKIEQEPIKSKEEFKPEPKEEFKPEPKEEIKPEPKEEFKPKPKEEIKPEPKEEIKPEPKEEFKPEPKEEFKPEPKEEIKPESVKPKPQNLQVNPQEQSQCEEPKAIYPINNYSTQSGSIDEKTIEKVIKMKGILDNYDKKERDFVESYFQKTNSKPSEIIYLALTFDHRSLEALNDIVTAKNHPAAERAFFLMSLSNDNIEAMHNQVNLLTGELGDLTYLSNDNKIEICRNLEKVIANLPSNVFDYIRKLQEFTSVTFD